MECQERVREGRMRPPRRDSHSGNRVGGLWFGAGERERGRDTHTEWGAVPEDRMCKGHALELVVGGVKMGMERRSVGLDLSDDKSVCHVEVCLASGVFFQLHPSTQSPEMMEPSM